MKRFYSILLAIGLLMAVPVTMEAQDEENEVVERDGSISDVKVARSIDPSLDKEAVRVMKMMPKWIPGKQKGMPIRVKYTVPITFKLTVDNSKNMRPQLRR